MPHQPGILAELPAAARYVSLRPRPGGDLRAALRALVDHHLRDDVVGIGSSITRELGVEIPGLREHPALVGPGIAVPSTPTALWLWLRGTDRGTLLHRARTLTAMVGDAFEVDTTLEAFKHGTGRDLTGYEDGTENPTDDAAVDAALVRGAGPGLDGSSFAAVQAWHHDLDRFEAKSPTERDHTIGRRISDNEELEDAPKSAHVKRTAQEDFNPEAFLVRRSMPWTAADGEGLVFVAFGSSFNAFEAQLRRMTGHDDGITDALFSFTRPVTGRDLWCPPIREARLDLSALGLG